MHHVDRYIPYDYACRKAAWYLEGFLKAIELQIVLNKSH